MKEQSSSLLNDVGEFQFNRNCVW